MQAMFHGNSSITYRFNQLYSIHTIKIQYNIVTKYFLNEHPFSQHLAHQNTPVLQFLCFIHQMNPLPFALRSWTIWYKFQTEPQTGPDSDQLSQKPQTKNGNPCLFPTSQKIIIIIIITNHHSSSSIIINKSSINCFIVISYFIADNFQHRHQSFLTI